MNKILTSPSKPPRVSVPVSAEVLIVFERLAKAGNMSTGRAMAEWLSDTVEGAEFMASTMERARKAPKIVTAELHAMLLGATDESRALMEKFSKMGSAARSGDADRAPPRVAIPPSCNTGGKVPRENPTKHAKGSK